MGHRVDGANPVAGFRDGFFVAGIMIAGGGALALLPINPKSDRARSQKRKNTPTPDFLRTKQVEAGGPREQSTFRRMMSTVGLLQRLH